MIFATWHQKITENNRLLLATVLLFVNILFTNSETAFLILHSFQEARTVLTVLI